VADLLPPFRVVRARAPAPGMMEPRTPLPLLRPRGYRPRTEGAPDVLEARRMPSRALPLPALLPRPRRHRWSTWPPLLPGGRPAHDDDIAAHASRSPGPRCATARRRPSVASRPRP
jgi:hypothetical protein